MQIDLATILAVYDRVLDGSISREQASGWARTICEADDRRVLKVRPESDRTAAWDALMFLWGCDLRVSGDAYLHDSRELLVHRHSLDLRALPPRPDGPGHGEGAQPRVRPTDAPLHRAACLAALDMIVARDAARLACSALERGLDSPALRVLSAVDDSDESCVRSILDRALRELGLPLPTRRSAALSLAQELAEQVIRSELPPYEGARLIWGLRLRATDEPISELIPFVYAEFELPKLADERRRFEAGIVEAATKLLVKNE